MFAGTATVLRVTVPAAILYARAARLERLAHDYGLQGRPRLHSIGRAIALEVQTIADRRLAA